MIAPSRGETILVVEDEADQLAVVTACLETAGYAPVGVVSVTVVVAEDDPDVTRIVDVQLRAAGYRSVLATDGEQALAAVRQHHAQVLVLDLTLPKVNGFDVLGQLRKASPLWPRIIVLSGRGREQDVARAFDLGADDYVTKPFNPQELMGRIARMLK